jgi:hypothetical protein
LAAVAGRKVKRDVASTNSNPDSKYGGHISDDSIGMLSTLKHNQEWLITLALSTRLARNTHNPNHLGSSDIK